MLYSPISTLCLLQSTIVLLESLVHVSKMYFWMSAFSKESNQPAYQSSLFSFQGTYTALQTT